MSVRDELLAIYERDGTITPEAVVAAAKPSSSALHSHFEWSNARAAEAYRLEQARDLIRSVRITVLTAPETTVRVRAFLNLPDAGYHPTAGVLGDDERRAVALQQCQRDIAALRRKYQDLLDVDAVLRSVIGNDGEAAA